ncbi:MAG TPA: alpha/beta hydrolase [Acidobacteriaceae bacterium]|nr:alpha/beta hydrolase [Acidobacteriaceae bacterium]
MFVASVLRPALVLGSFALASAIAVSQSAPAPTSIGWQPPAGAPTLTLWPNGAPGPQTATGPEHDTTKPTDNLIMGRPLIRTGDVSTPTITLYAAPAARNSGAGVVVFPGGGYSILAMDLEGTEVCDWLNAIGVNCVLLKYRVPNTGPYPKSAAALQDAQRAVGLVREHATEWKIDPKRLGVLGFSAGGHLAAALSTHFDQRLYPAIDAADQLSCRPDFAIIIYPGYLALSEKNFEFNPDIPVTANTPPAFLVQAEDDPVHVENAIEYFMALKKAGVSAELHVYAQGGHGYGLRPGPNPVTHWPELAQKWLVTMHVIFPR